MTEFDAWLMQQNRKPFSQSGINKHNAALNRVLDEAELQSWLVKPMRPTLLNKGVKSESRGSFTDADYKKIYTALRTWHKKNKKACATRDVLRKYVLFLTTTGVRHGTDAVPDSFTRQVKRLPAVLLRSMTYDRRSEIRDSLPPGSGAALENRHLVLRSPRPWQRGSSENTHSLLRQFMPKGTDLSSLGQTCLNDVTALVNNRLSKTLGCKTPADAMADETAAFTSTVALDV